MSNISTEELRLQEEVAGRMTRLKNENERLAMCYDRLGYEQRAERVSECGTFLQYVVSAEGSRLRCANFCRDRLCPMCQKRRSLKIFAQASDAMNWIELHHRCRYVFLTLTVRNCYAEELKKTIDVLMNGFHQLSHKSKLWKKSVLGCMRALEITRNPVDGSWHPHLHVILAVPASYYNNYSKYWISTRDWVQEWRKCCELDYDPICYAEAVKNNNRSIALEVAGGPDKQSRSDSRKALDVVLGDESLSVSYRDAVAGAAKYISKGCDTILGAAPEVDMYGQLINPHLVLSDEVIDDNVRTMLECISGRRLIGWTGLFREARRALSLDDVEVGDLVHIETELRPDLSYIVVTYKWRSGVYLKI